MNTVREADPLVALGWSVFDHWVDTCWSQPSPVERQFSAIPFPPFAAIRRLLDAGVPAALVGALCGDGALRVARVNLRGRRWEPEGPDARLLIGIRDECGAMIDVVAIASHAPGDWALLTGAAAMLGAAAVIEAERAACIKGGARLRLFADPWGWLMAGGDGVCVFDWNLAAPALRALGENVTIVADGGGARSVLARLTRGGLPRVAEVQVEEAGLTLAERIGRRVA